MTNDFVALLKDSSLVSVLTVMELTKQTQIFATNLGSWVIPGALCAALYLAMSLPLSALARRLEERWKAADRLTDAGRSPSAICTCDAAVRAVLAGVSFDVGRGEIVALMGASGSGKTTILRTIAGLEPFERGTARRRRRHARRRAAPSRVTRGAARARSAWCFSFTASSST